MRHPKQINGCYPEIVQSAAEEIIARNRVQREKDAEMRNLVQW